MVRLRLAPILLVALLLLRCGESSNAPASTSAPVVEASLAATLTVSSDSSDTAPPAVRTGDDIPRPNPALTPGAVFPNVTAADVCKSGYSKSVRNVPDSERKRVLTAYHWTASSSTFELDHLISLELGGSNDAANLWPEPYAGSAGARRKDVLENKLHALVCAGSLDLATAQQSLARDWWAAYQQYVGK